MKFNIPFGIIYKVTNLINSKCYIGQTTQKFYKRKYDHIYEAINKKTNMIFHNALRKYGIENFKWEVLIECSSRAVLNEMETLMIIEHVSHINFKKGYNLTWCDKGKNGYKCSEKTKRKLSEANKGKKWTDDTRKKQSIIKTGMKYKKMSNEGKNNIKEAHKGKKQSKETIKKRFESRKGYKPSEETKKKMSESHKKNYKYQNTIWINFNGDVKRVNKNEIQNFIYLGWKRGMK